MPYKKGSKKYKEWIKTEDYKKFCDQRRKPMSKETKKKLSDAQKKTFEAGRVPWAKGLSAKTDQRLAALGKKISKTMKGRVRSPEHCKKLSDAMTPERRAAYSKRMKENNPMKDPDIAKKVALKNTGEGNVWYGKKRPEHSKLISKLMREGQAVAMLAKIRNPSKPQMELYNHCQQVFPYPILNYSHYGRFNFSIDVAVPQLSLAIEYDGSYWHQDKKKEKWRQSILEGVGWRFLRYVDRVPTPEELLYDYNKLGQ